MDKSTIIGVIGAGTMGSGIAQVAAIAGHKTFIFDTNDAALAKALADLKKNVNRLLEKGKITDDQVIGVIERVSTVNSLAKLSEAGFIIEAIVEDLDVKKKVFRELESLVSADCILATNTSSLSITSIGAACADPGRFIGVHFFNPAPLMPLVEIVPGLATSDQTGIITRKLIDSWGKTTVMVKDTPGFIVNRIARPYYGEALRIFEEQWNGLPAGEKGMATIDWAMKEFGGFKMGPFELMDMIGNDINYTVTETVWKQFFYDPRYRPSVTQKRLFESGRFGKKTGRGYYDYTPGIALPEPEQNRELGMLIFSRILAMLINEAVDALYLNVASRDAIDLAMTKGVNYPKGLLQWCDEAGSDTIYNVLNSLKNVYSEERYRPSILLQQMTAGKLKFYN